MAETKSDVADGTVASTAMATSSLGASSGASKPPHVSALLQSLDDEIADVRCKASLGICRATAWVTDADASDRNFANREKVGELGGVGIICNLLMKTSDPNETIQHWVTLSQLCMCPKNAAEVAADGMLTKCTEILSCSNSKILRTAVTLCVANFCGFCWTNTALEVISAGLISKRGQD